MTLRQSQPKLHSEILVSKRETKGLTDNFYII